MTAVVPSDLGRPAGPIIEGLVTTLTREGGLHIAAQGPIFLNSGEWLFRPYPGSITCDNMLRGGEGVFHITDDALLLAHVVAGVEMKPQTRAALRVQGGILMDCTRYWEFRVIARETRGSRYALRAEVLATDVIQPPTGWNRARNAILEAAILATRVGLLPRAQIELELSRLQPLVDKTAGPAELQAWDLIIETIAHRAALPGGERGV